MKSSKSLLLTLVTVIVFVASAAIAEDLVHDAEYYILKAQNGERWAEEDAEIDAKLEALRKKHGLSSSEATHLLTLNLNQALDPTFGHKPTSLDR